MATVVRWSGEQVDVARSDRRKRFEAVRPRERQLPLLAGESRKARSTTWDEYLRSSGNAALLVPESAIVPLLEKVGWTPADETRQAGPCSIPLARRVGQPLTRNHSTAP